MVGRTAERAVVGRRRRRLRVSAGSLPVDVSAAAAAAAATSVVGTTTTTTMSTMTAATTTAATSTHAFSAVLTAVASLKAFVFSSIDPVVFLATASASLKLIVICCAVKYLSDSKKIPANTSVVLAQISFQLLIPCMLFVKVVQILAMESLDTRLLLGMGLAAVLQIGIGSFWGRLLAPLVDEDNEGRFLSFVNTRRRASHAVAEATSRAIGVASTKEALLPKPERSSKGFKSLVAVAGAFQNSFTLPAVFLLSLLPGAVADRAVAYLGLYLLAWSPCLWSFGLYTIQKGYRDEAAGAGAGGENDGGGKFRLKDVLKNTLNPPVVAVFVAAALGLTPVGKALFGLGVQSATLPFELSILYYVFQNVYDVVQMLGEGTLPIQTLVLAASLLDKGGKKDVGEKAGVVDFARDGATPGEALVSSLSLSPPVSASSAPPFSVFKSVVGFFRGDSVVESRALAILATIRFVLMPTSAILMYKLCSRVPLFAPILADPILMFVLAVQAVMPSAQNLLIALQLSPLTQGAAAGTSLFSSMHRLSRPSRPSRLSRMTRGRITGSTATRFAHALVLSAVLS